MAVNSAVCERYCFRLSACAAKPRSSLPAHNRRLRRISICSPEQDPALIRRSTATSAALVRSAAWRSRNHDANGYAVPLCRAYPQDPARADQTHPPESKDRSIERMLRIATAVHPQNTVQIYSHLGSRSRIKGTRSVDPCAAIAPLSSLTQQRKQQCSAAARFGPADFGQGTRGMPPRVSLSIAMMPVGMGSFSGRLRISRGTSKRA